MNSCCFCCVRVGKKKVDKLLMKWKIKKKQNVSVVDCMNVSLLIRCMRKYGT